MVFAPTHDLPSEAHEPAAQPRRRDHVKPPPPAPSHRLPWRAVVRTGAKDTSAQTTWHMAGCVDEHCTQGQQLIASLGDPDGHCLIEGQCLRCAAPAT